MSPWAALKPEGAARDGACLAIESLGPTVREPRADTREVPVGMLACRSREARAPEGASHAETILRELR